MEREGQKKDHVVGAGGKWRLSDTHMYGWEQGAGDMKRRGIARQTLEIMERGYYETGGRKVEIAQKQAYSVEHSLLVTPQEGCELLAGYEMGAAQDCAGAAKRKAAGELPGIAGYCTVKNCGTVDAILELCAAGKAPAVLNFASAKNPGGGFINGAMAQEESLAASGCLYKTLLAHEEYYHQNRACGTMMYTDHAIYSPEVVFFRDGRFDLLEEPVTASVLTLPAVNMGQVILKGEDIIQAQRVMRRRMLLALAIFAKQGCQHLVLGAYGCGVFRNDPQKVAKWWDELLSAYFPHTFESIVFAVLDRSADRKCISAFEKTFL